MATPALAGGAMENQNVRLKPVQLQADIDALTALNGFVVYPPANTAYAKTAAAAEWDFHNTMLAVKEQVIAQFGKNSDQVQALGLKKKSEYKAPARKAKAP
jgi:hypothetical protein